MVIPPSESPFFESDHLPGDSSALSVASAYAAPQRKNGANGPGFLNNGLTDLAGRIVLNRLSVAVGNLPQFLGRYCYKRCKHRWVEVASIFANNLGGRLLACDRRPVGTL